MYDFYDRLMKGESAEDIAKSITDELNKAQKQKEEAEKAKQADKAKRAKAEEVTKALNEYLALYHPTLNSKMSVDDFIKTMEATAKASQVFDKAFNNLEKAKDKGTKSVDDLIDDFLTKMGW